MWSRLKKLLEDYHNGKTELEKFRSRWFRWLGQMTRCDRDTWAELLDCNWSDWANKVLDRADHPY